MVDTSAAAGGYGIAIALLSLGGLLTLTIVGGIIGVPLMLIGVLMAFATWRSDPEESDDADDAEPA